MVDALSCGDSKIQMLQSDQQSIQKVKLSRFRINVELGLKVCRLAELLQTPTI